MTSFCEIAIPNKRKFGKLWQLKLSDDVRKSQTTQSLCDDTARKLDSGDPSFVRGGIITVRIIR